MNKWIAEFELEDGDAMPEHMELNYIGGKIDFHCRPMWIPVSERLPDKTSKYIVTIGINRFGFGMYDEVSIATYNIKSGWFCVEDNKDTIIGEVIAWMPLPKPYRTESEDKE